jgi:hypothetical protein
MLDYVLGYTQLAQSIGKQAGVGVAHVQAHAVEFYGLVADHPQAQPSRWKPSLIQTAFLAQERRDLAA